MSTSNLTAKYRPQTFSDVAGQEAVKAILSRAAAQDKVAPAYLFSGTRGVGKTTIARIFAKALNCVEAPTGEPCNKCQHCRQITAGVAPDVIEIDGASNRGIDDARRLKEDIGYAPIECRYKVFIIDEAHMLTKEAFNALLKTLEEPPARATFILATTEPHKFPATIISRCQHYTYKMLAQNELYAHLEKIMNLEGLQFEPGALQIIAKRGAGSVRDSMSLLGQALAMGQDVLREEDVRGFLGLAGQEVFFRLMEAMHSRNLVNVGHVLREVLDQGLDLGFFLRELTACWRNMFLLRQAGTEAMPLLGLSQDEAASWMDWAGKFDPAHIHACWQMTLDGQRRVMTSLEPAMALELLLLNLTSLPDLISLESVGTSAGQGGSPSAPPRSNGPARGGAPGGRGTGNGMRQQGTPQGNGRQFARNDQRREPQAPQPSQTPQAASQQGYASQHRPQQFAQAPAQPSMQNPGQPAGQQMPPQSRPSHGAQSFQQQAREQRSPAQGSARPSEQEEDAGSRPVPASAGGTGRDWQGFLDLAEERNGSSPVRAHVLRLTSGELNGNDLVIRCKSRVQCDQLNENKTFHALDLMVREYFGPMVEVRVETGNIQVRKSDRQLMAEAEKHPGVQLIMESFDARIMAVDHRK